MSKHGIKQGGGEARKNKINDSLEGKKEKKHRKSESVKFNHQIQRRASQRYIHSSKVTDPHRQLLLKAKRFIEKPDEERKHG